MEVIEREGVVGNRGASIRGRVVGTEVRKVWFIRKMLIIRTIIAHQHFRYGQDVEGGGLKRIQARTSASVYEGGV